MHDVGATIAGTIRRWAGRTPQAPCLSFNGRTRTWREVHDRASRIGHGLVEAGLTQEERVLFLGRNSPEYVEILCGVSMAGGVLTAVNWRLAPDDMLEVANDSEARIAFVDAEFVPALDEFASRLTTVTTVIVLGGSDPDRGYESWLAGQVAKDPGVPVAEQQTVLQVYTSGTTGRPKGAAFSNAAVRGWLDLAGMVGIDAGSVVLVAMPVFHAIGSSLCLMGLDRGAHLVISRDAKPRGLLSLVRQYGVTTSILVPSVVKTLLDAAIDEAGAFTLETVAYAGSPISSAVLRSAQERFGCRFVQIYGMSETAAVTVLSPADHQDTEHPEHPERLLSCGRALPGVTLRIVDSTSGLEVLEGHVGEVWVKASTTMQGYWHAPQETAEAITPDGFVRSGDGGCLRDGYLYLTDRVKDMIISGGENIYPAEVEHVLMTHPGIADAAVIAVPSARWGETVKAIIVAEDASAPPTADDVITYTKARLARYKCPTSVGIVAELPRNASGKVLKRVLRAPYWRGHDREVG
ncbi:AMP-binding protein [Streptomyces sp. NPDC002143]